MHTLAARFRGCFPVVVDLETSGFHHDRHCILELAMQTLTMNEHGLLSPSTTHHFHIQPFEGAELCPKSLEFTGIDPFNPLRAATSEECALKQCFKAIKVEMKAHECHRAILVGHNAHFDHGFINAAVSRCEIKRNPFHPFGSFDTATMAGVMLGQTVLAKACKTLDIEFDGQEAHSALYDTNKTAELFCTLLNRYQQLGGWPLEAFETQDKTATEPRAE